jgi:hypothetical protein
LANGQRGVGDLTAEMQAGRDKGRSLAQALAAREPHGWFMPDQRGGQPGQGVAAVWTTELGHLRGRMHRGPRRQWAGCKPRRGPQVAHRRQARPSCDRRPQVGHERRCGTGQTGDMPGGGVPYQVRESGRQLRALVLGESDALPCAGEQAQMDRLRGRRGSQGALCGLGKPLGVRGSKGAPMAREALASLLRRPGQHLIGSGTQRSHRLAALARSRRLAQGRFRVVLAQPVGQDAFDPSQSRIPPSTPGHWAPLEPPRECLACQRPWFWKPSGCIAPAAQKFSTRRPVDGIVLLTRSRLLGALMGDRSRIAHRSGNLELSCARHSAMKMVPQLFIRDLGWLHAHAHQWGWLDLSDGLEPSEQDCPSLT